MLGVTVQHMIKPATIVQKGVILGLNVGLLKGPKTLGHRGTRLSTSPKDLWTGIRVEVEQNKYSLVLNKTIL